MAAAPVLSASVACAAAASVAATLASAVEVADDAPERGGCMGGCITKMPVISQAVECFKTPAGNTGMER